MERVVEGGNLRRAPETRAAEQGQSGRGRTDGGGIARVSQATLAGDSGATAHGALPAERGEARGDSEAGRRGAHARHPDRAGSVHSAGRVTGPATAIRSHLLRVQLWLSAGPSRARRGAVRRSGTCRAAGAGWWTWTWSSSLTASITMCSWAWWRSGFTDPRMLRLIRRYLEAGMMVNGVVVERHEGTPQGGPLSPLLANVLLDVVDQGVGATRTPLRALRRRLQCVRAGRSERRSE